MALVRNKNPTELAFLHWVSMFPESTHSFDRRRFHVFVRCIARYNSKKWLRERYFEQRILEHKPYFDTDLIRTLHDQLVDLLEFHRAGPIQPLEMVDDLPDGYYEREVRDKKIHTVQAVDPYTNA